MNILLIPLVLALGRLGLAAFLWCLRADQYDDLDGAARRLSPLDEEIAHLLVRVRQACLRVREQVVVQAVGPGIHHRLQRGDARGWGIGMEPGADGRPFPHRR